jgi:hypothetical protein
MEQAGLYEMSCIRQTSWLDNDLTSLVFGKLGMFAKILYYLKIRQALALHPRFYPEKSGINEKTQIKSFPIRSN